MTRLNINLKSTTDKHIYYEVGHNLPKDKYVIDFIIGRHEFEVDLFEKIDLVINFTIGIRNKETHKTTYSRNTITHPVKFDEPLRMLEFVNPPFDDNFDNVVDAEDRDLADEFRVTLKIK